MARGVARLSAKKVANAPKGMHCDGGGLYLHVDKRGARSWIFRFMLNGRAREMGLGPTHTISLAEARDRARHCRHQLLDGIDPIEERHAQDRQALLDRARAMTFQQCAEAYISAHRAGWKNDKHAAQWPSTLGTYVYPVFGALPVDAIDEALVIKVLEPIWATKTETATRVRQRIEAVLDWAIVRKFREGPNPARWKGHLDHLLPKPAKVRKVEHHAALPYAELDGFIAALRRQEGLAARALELAILTVTRTNEVLGAPWSEINLADRLWTIPAERMKGGREHRIPLSAPAIAILDGLAQSRNGKFVFPGARPGRPLSNMAMLMLLRRMGHGDLMAHGFRSSFSDWCAECTAFPAEVREMALAHTVGEKVEAAYRRGDLFQKRRQLMDAWARHCAGASAPAGEVVPLRQAAAQ
jgi:integrase